MSLLPKSLQQSNVEVPVVGGSLSLRKWTWACRLLPERCSVSRESNTSALSWSWLKILLIAVTESRPSMEAQSLDSGMSVAARLRSLSDWMEVSNRPLKSSALTFWCMSLTQMLNWTPESARKVHLSVNFLWLILNSMQFVGRVLDSFEFGIGGIGCLVKTVEATDGWCTNLGCQSLQVQHMESLQWLFVTEAQCNCTRTIYLIHCIDFNGSEASKINKCDCTIGFWCKKDQLNRILVLEVRRFLKWFVEWRIKTWFAPSCLGIGAWCGFSGGSSNATKLVLSSCLWGLLELRDGCQCQESCSCRIWGVFCGCPANDLDWINGLFRWHGVLLFQLLSKCWCGWWLEERLEAAWVCLLRDFPCLHLSTRASQLTANSNLLICHAGSAH